MTEDSSWLDSSVMDSLVKGDSYLVIISRVDIVSDITNRVEYAAKSIFNMHCDGRKHWCTSVLDDFCVRG